MRITFIRHLPTDWNAKQKLQGRRDIDILPITKKFQEGIVDNQRVLAEWSPFDLVLASTLKRTHQTAKAYGYRFETEGLLDELDFGLFEGRSKKDLLETYGDQWLESPKELVLGESVANLEERIILFLDKYKDRNNMLVFGHGSWIRAIVSHYDYGHINNMNKMIVGNNECLTLKFKS